MDLQTKERHAVKLDKVYPYIVVNIGSGVSILKVGLPRRPPSTMLSPSEESRAGKY